MKKWINRLIVTLHDVAGLISVLRLALLLSLILKLTKPSKDIPIFRRLHNRRCLKNVLQKIRSCGYCIHGVDLSEQKCP